MPKLIALTLLAATVIACSKEDKPAPAIALPKGDFILNLYDAFGPEVPGTRQDFGFSALIRYRGKLILFDSGTDANILKQNIDAFGVDLREIDFAVASHSHFDHISGFDYVLSVNPKLKIYFPPDPFWGAELPFDITGRDAEAKNELPKEQQYFGGGSTKIKLQGTGRFWKANIEFVSEHTEIEPGIDLILTRSPFLGYFSRYPQLGIKEFDNQKGDTKTMGLPELSLSLKTDEGDVLVVGCSHSLVTVITKTAKEHLNRPIGTVMGGFHLLPYKEKEIRGIAEQMRDEFGVTRVAPAHCTGHLGFKVFREVFGEQYQLAGLGSVVRIAK
jgi:7,8-dihydropterin-6-yl-methyl-4-(beta-D-ribofuranosyl)aminobenzene 5'-phosphate synthase